jgi:hypothetical protein
MAKRAESVERWVAIDNAGHYSTDDNFGNFSEHFAEAYVFLAKPKRTVAVRPIPVRVSIVPGRM